MTTSPVTPKTNAITNQTVISNIIPDVKPTVTTTSYFETHTLQTGSSITEAGAAV